MAGAFTFVDLFAGIGGFHAALSHAGGTCVFASEIDSEARKTYQRNWAGHQDVALVLDGDLTVAATDSRMDVREHDVLAAGFPCQPFSKSGRQLGMDEARGTLFWNIAKVLEERRPSLVLLENVRNIAGPRHAHEWTTIITTLRQLGYRVSSTPSVFSPHLLPPELGGTPQSRDRVFIVGSYVGAPRALEEIGVEPTVLRAPVDDWDVSQWKVDWVLDDDDTIQNLDRYRVTARERDWINTWDSLVRSYQDRRGERLPSHPLWSDMWQRSRPSGAQLDAMPTWKTIIVEKNLDFYDCNRSVIDAWRKAHPGLASFPATRRKLEWQAQGADSLWKTLMQMRPSGIRARPPTYVPALVAMSQTSVVGPRRRKLTPREAARLQGLPEGFEFDNRAEAASYKQVGNGVSVGAAWHVLRAHVSQDHSSSRPQLPARLRNAILRAPLNPSPGVLSPDAYESPAASDRVSWGELVALA